MENNNETPEEKKPGYPMHKRRYTPIYTIIVFLYGILVKLLFFMKIEGKENVPKDRNCILMGNHQCLLDPVTLALCVPDREIHFMGKKELFEKKFLGWIFRQGLITEDEYNRTKIHMMGEYGVVSFMTA